MSLKVHDSSGLDMLSPVAQSVSSDPDDRFLIIEDNRADQVLLRVFFRRAGVRDGQLTFASALSELKSESYKAIVCDLNIRDSEHLETLKAVRSHYPQTPIVVLTGLASYRLGLQAIELGAQDYLIKGQFNDEEFFKSVLFAIQRHSLQRDLFLSREEYEELFNANPQPVFVYNLENLAIVKVNTRFCQVYGYTPEEARQLTLEDIRAEKDHNRIREDLEKLQESGFLELSAITHRKKSGEAITVEVFSQYLRNTDFPAAIATVNDISNKAAVEKSLLLKNERLEQAMRVTRDVLYDWDMATNKLVWGESLAEQFGYETGPGQFNIYAWTQSVHPDDRAAFVDHLDKVLSGVDLNPTHDREYRLRRSDGSYAHVTDRSIVIRSDEGESLRIIGVIEDITDRGRSERTLKNAYHLLREINSKYEELFAEVSAFICYLKGQDHVFKHSNPEFEWVSGKCSVIGMKLREALPEFVDQGIVAHLDTVQQEEPEGNGIRHANTTNNPIQDESGDVSGEACYARDVTKHTLYLKALEKQNRQFKEIAWLQSHVVRAPLARILGLIDLLKNGDDPSVSAEQLIDYLAESASELDKVITEISTKTELMAVIKNE